MTAPVIALGSIYVFLGLTALVVAAVRRRRSVATLVWAGLFVGLFGARMLSSPPVAMAINAVILIPALMFWLELSVGAVRHVLEGAVTIAVGLALYAFVSSDSLLYARLLTVLTLSLLAIVSAVPYLARRYLVVQSRVLGAGMVITAVAVVSLVVTDRRGSFVEPVAFAAFVFSLLYIAARKLFGDERRLLAIQNELEVARRIQRSILPTTIPEIEGIRIDVAYDPTSAVGGDFYDFIPLGPSSVGILIADVTGHGVPAAMIASMIKVAMQPSIHAAHEPSRFLTAMNRVLTPQLRGQLVSAAYLVVDGGRACYAAAGHPPLIWCDHSGGAVRHMTSNGLLFGVREEASYPTQEFALTPGDRIVLYTDGLVEAENDGGQPIGLERIDRVLQESHSISAAKLAAASSNWAAGRQDDITVIAVDFC